MACPPATSVQSLFGVVLALLSLVTATLNMPSGSAEGSEGLRTLLSDVL